MEQITQISGMVLGLVAVLGTAGLPSKFKGLVAVAIGVGLAYLYNGLNAESIIIGIISALSASGLWSNVKTVTKSVADVEEKG